MDTTTDLSQLNRLIRECIQDPGTSHWLRNALQAAQLRDPVDAANDAFHLADLLGVKAALVNESAMRELIAHRSDGVRMDSPSPTAVQTHPGCRDIRAGMAH